MQAVITVKYTHHTSIYNFKDRRQGGYILWQQRAYIVDIQSKQTVAVIWKSRGSGRGQRGVTHVLGQGYWNLQRWQNWGSALSCKILP